MAMFGRGIPVSAGFDLSARRPLDSRTWCQNHAEMESMPAVRKFQGLKTYVIDEDVQYKWNGSDWVIDHTGLTSGSGSPVASTGATGDIYIDKSNGDVWYKVFNRASETIEWSLMFNITGPKGDQGDTGPKGTRGSIWTSGTACTGTDTAGVIFPSTGITQANINDQYLNIMTGNVYQCIVAGNSTIAEWSYMGCIIGPKGEQGEQGIQGIQGEQGEQGIQGEQGLHGSYIYTTEIIYGPTPTPIAFPDADDLSDIDINVGDYCLNNAYGHLYEALESGKGNVVKWNRCLVINGSKLYIGKGISASSDTSIIAPSSGVGYANINDSYINMDNGQVFICVVEGVSSVAQWKMIGSITIESALNDVNGSPITSYLKNATPNNNVLTFEKGDGTTFDITLNQPVFKGATTDSNGVAGSVPAPIAGDTTNLYLNASGSWKSIPVYGIASSTVAGIIKNGDTLSISADGVLNVKDNSHSHTIDNVTGLQNELDGKSPKAGNEELVQIGNDVIIGSDGASPSIKTKGGPRIQKIQINNDNTDGNSVFEFQESSDAGSSYKSLMKILDDGTVESEKFKGNLLGKSSTSGTADESIKLKTARGIALNGAATGTSTEFDGTKDIIIPVTELDATKLTGEVPIECLPKEAVSVIKTVSTDDDRFALTIDEVQNGDIVAVDSTKKMYYVVDDTKLNEESGYKEFEAGIASQVDWSGVMNKPESYPPSDHTHPYVPNAGGNVSGDITFDTKTDDSIGIGSTDSDWGLKAKYDSNNQIEYLEEYITGQKPIYIRQKDSSGIVIKEVKLLDENGNTTFPGTVTSQKFIGPLEGQATKATQDSDGNQINATYIKSVTPNGRTLTFEKGDGSTFDIKTQDTDTKYNAFIGASSSENGTEGLVPAPTANDNVSYLRGDGRWVHINPGTISTEDITLTVSGWTESNGKYRQEITCTPTITENTNILLIPTATEENLKQIWNSFVIGIEQDNTNNKIKFQADSLPTANITYRLQYYLE